MYKLVLMRHGESQWNLENRFTGWADVDLTETGRQQAKEAGLLLAEKGYSFDELCKPSTDKSTNPFLEALRTAEIQLESVVLVDIMVNFLNRLKSDLSDPLGINTTQIDLLLKYKLIMMQMSLPHTKMKERILNTFTQ